MPQSKTCRQTNTAILNNHEDGGLAIICASPGKKLQRSNKRTSWKNGQCEKTKSSPACCRQRHEYPPGYSVFECRLDGNQPIAQVVQVPSDTADNIIQNKTCMLLETKQAEFGPTSRIVAYPSGEASCRRRRVTEPMSFALESRNGPDGAVACAEKVSKHVNQHSAMCSTQPVTILETAKGPMCQSGPSSRLVYGPVSQKAAKSSGTYDTPGFYIQCTTTPEGPIARVTQVPREFSSSSGDPSTNYEAFVKHDGSCPTAMVTQCNNNQEISQGACNILETLVDASGPRARALNPTEESSNFRHITHLDVRSQENGPFARICQRPGQPQEIVSSLRTKQINPLNCCSNYQASPVTCAQNPLKSARTCRIKYAGGKVMPNMRRRNGLSPTQSELQGHTGLCKNNKIRRGRVCVTPKSVPAYCCRPVSSPDPASSVCRPQPVPCASKRSPTSAKRPTSAYIRSGTCLCPVQQQREGFDYPFSVMRPLPGGTVVPKCPPPSLPEIAPVPLGPFRLRDYKPRPKTSGPRNATSGSPLRSRPTANKTTKKKTKNKKTGSSGKHRKSQPEMDEAKDEAPTQVSQETYVECPAFASKGSQSVDICNKSSSVECPACESKGIQSVDVCNKSSSVGCPAFESKGSQSDPVPKEPSDEKNLDRNKSICRFEEPVYVKCPFVASRKSSRTSSVYVPRNDVLVSQCSGCVRSKILETSIGCCAKRNRFQEDKCHPLIPETVLRISYEQRRNRHARTLISSGTRHRRFDDEVNEIGRATYCVRA